MISQAEKRQFRCLYRVFLLRIVDFDVLSTRGDVHKLLGQLTAIFAAFSLTFVIWKALQSAFVTLKMTPEQALRALRGEQEFLIATTMAIAAIVTVVTWDSLFPTRLDVLVLGSLPVRRRTLIGAKVAAAVAALGLTCTALNAFTGLAYPFLVLPPGAGFAEAFRSLAAYWFTMMCAAFSVFCGLAAMQGLIAQILNYRAYLRASSYLQVALMFVIITVYFLKPPLAQSPGDWSRIVPSIWFLGLIETLNGSTLPEVSRLSERAGWSTVIAIGAAALAFVLGYARNLKAAVEAANVPAARRRSAAARLAHVLTEAAITRSLDRAILLFTARTLTRSRQHRVLLAAWVGAGLAIALIFLRNSIYSSKTRWDAPNLSMVSVGFLLLFFLIIGIRSLATLPFELRANWLFKITETRSSVTYFLANRKTLLLIAAAPVCIGSAVVFGSLWPANVAGRHIVILVLSGMLLVNLVLRDFNKVPFTCSYLPGKANLNITLGVYALLFLFFGDLGLRTELWALNRASRFVVLTAIMTAAVVWASGRAKKSISDSRHGLIFDESPKVETLTLDLSSRDKQTYTDLAPAPRTERPQRLVARYVAALFLLLCSGLIYESVAEVQDRRRFPQIGTSIDIGGRSLNLHCAGEGGPVVVLDSGLNVAGYSWKPVQSMVAKFARACWFDRAGYGWSDSGPTPRTSAKIAAETRKMLKAAGLHPPYILVGHSFGGFNVRVYAAMYPNEVAGLVLVDSAYENDETDVRMRVADPPLKRLLPVQAQNIVAGVWPYIGRLGLVRLLSDENASIPRGVLTRHDADLLQSLQLQAKSMQAFIDEGKAWPESAEQVRAIRTFGDLPLRVITGGRFVGAGSDAAELRKASAFHDAWVNDIQANLARLSTNGRQIVVPTSGHAVPYEAPEIISSSIEAMIPSLKERPESPPAPNASTGP